jgi:hypothetical protein
LRVDDSGFTSAPGPYRFCSKDDRFLVLQNRKDLNLGDALHVV